MSSLVRIKQLYHSLAQNERKLADFILSSPEQLGKLSSQELANTLGISQSSVVKFAQKLGFRGFPALKQDISAHLLRHQAPANEAALHHGILRHDPLKVVGEKLMAEKIAALQSTLTINHEEQLQQALRMLLSARRIVITGLGASGLVAKDFANKLMQIGLAAYAESDAHVQIVCAQAMQPQDLLMAISYSGERKEVNMAAATARRRGAQVLALTGFSPNPLQDLASLTLYTVIDAHADQTTAISSRIAQSTLTDLLYMGIVQQNAEHACLHIRNSCALVKTLE
ncbi:MULTISPECIES: MurR/RpiR family transcriptional regulator [Edwardsiella]|uniref:MurR/RpiR family transcriptional regulator n=1 Tax=Edwardsiella anguillarum TaxID=1821960 RepID=A0ABY8SI82_9GAMM|nr:MULTISPECIES: MurR/RpiR family transcriptional regulator [Edwardsiella]AKM48683.1 transcriptional regulator [Edwardsiella sp. EA181011]AKR76944.1 MurR/RpiR family transcriptional regulator [Edwardsiella sp. LADL05-105]KAB0592274.1 MurR/RpiR family transcriptional regulator [Edwardsiella anguillarum]RFS99830.1 MurR/RpiR family transcriptional regulator [Edwardsiella anguillarum]UOU79869.1 MurR/RpiR family transcriptional regulator [Edwardsiella anguillarum]